MRLLRLKIRNIASLRGEHQIDFQDIQHHSSLFAITGETGAGKSTILNAIGLALYGQVYKKNVQQIDVVTLGEKDGSIELIFQVKGKSYLADWRVRVLKQNGEPYSSPQSPVRTLYELSGDQFNSPKNATTLPVHELLNLDFDQFCKCIILNQGEFARFLTSSFAERKEILEKLYPGELLESMGRELKNELSVLEKKKNELEIKLGELKGDPVSGETLRTQKKELDKDLTDLENIYGQIDKLDYHFISLKSYHEKNETNEKKKLQIRSDLKVETTKFNDFLKNGEKLQEASQGAQKELSTELPKLQELAKKEESLKNINESLLDKNKRLESLVADIDQNVQKLEQHSQNQKTLAEEMNKTRGLISFNIESLKSLKDLFDPIVDRFTERELLLEQQLGKKERLKHLELSGQELKLLVKSLEDSLALIPKDIKDQEEALSKRRKEIQDQKDKFQRTSILLEELNKDVNLLFDQKKITEEEIQKIQTRIKVLETEKLSLETTLKLQEIFSAKDICLTHALEQDSPNCPVCESSIEKAKLILLKENLRSTDFMKIKSHFEEKSQEYQKEQNIFSHLTQKLQENTKAILDKKAKTDQILKDHVSFTFDTDSLDKELDILKEKSWKKVQIEKDLLQKNAELDKIRASFKETRHEVQEIQNAIDQKSLSLDNIHESFKSVFPIINRDSIRELKLLKTTLLNYLEIESRFTKMIEVLDLTKKNTDEKKAQRIKLDAEIAEMSSRKTLIQSELSVLQGEKASTLMQKLTEKAKTSAEILSRHLELQKQQELTIKDAQGRLSQMEELSKEFDLLFSKEIMVVQDISKTLPDIFIKLRSISLNFQSSVDLFIPFYELIQSEKKLAKEKTDTCRMTFSSVSTRLVEWEKVQDKIQLLLLQHQDVVKEQTRKLRLDEVLGKDELRNFVLSLVEENLILQTNEELQKLCQGRYEILHQTKSLRMVPEFYILDKFREGGKRKVSTLSGGETFMVSLAMALGLAEMTRGKAEIDSLFIDEGFGTLDQDSLEDVLDMLQQIQTRGLMVGIISHIKPLTESLPVNLRVTKGQNGTSTIDLRFN